MPPRRRFQLQSIPPPDRQELLPVELNGRNYDLIYDPRCRVCRLGPDGVHVVNKMLAEGFTYRDIAKQVQNLDIPNGPHKLTTDQIRTHFEKHLPAKTGAVRTIIEHRAAQMQKDFIEGTENLVSPYVYAEVLLQKAFQDMATSRDAITPKDGIEAAKLIHQFNKEEASNSDMAEALSQLNKIISAVRDVVPPEMFSQIISKIEGNEITNTTIDAVEEDDDEEEINVIDENEEAEYEVDDTEGENDTEDEVP